jgi:hypothetical protein
VIQDVGGLTELTLAEQQYNNPAMMIVTSLSERILQELIPTTDFRVFIELCIYCLQSWQT